MELPIRIMITLFVTLIVGSTIIFFAKGVIEDAKEDLRASQKGYDVEDLEDQKIIQLSILTESQIIDLINECYNKHHLETLTRELCFVVIADSASEWSWYDIEDHFLNKDGFYANVSIIPEVEDGDDSMSIYFNPYGDTETIELRKK